MTATTKNGFNTVSQAGSGISWTGLSNMPYPTEGEAAAELTAAKQTSNRISLIVPYESAGIPTGSTFDDMTLYVSIKKTGTFSSGTNVNWYFDTNLSTSLAATYTLTVDESYRNISIAGDAAYWRISGTSAQNIISYLKTGSLYPRVYAKTASAIACGVRIKSVTIVINYTTVRAERAAIIATLV